MATENKTEELIAYLKSLGFEGETLAANIRKGYDDFKPFMYINHRIPFGDEMMRYQLRFVYDRQFMAYRLESYDAFHRGNVIIDHKNLNGVDTAELEKSMADIDWEYYFYCEMNDVKFDRDLGSVFQDLWSLSDDDSRNSGGFDIQSKLIYKYWPSGHWNDEADKLQFVYETKKTFCADERGICNAKLAYYNLSGHLDTLYSLIKDTGLEKYPETDIAGQIALGLSSGQDRFNIQGYNIEKEGVIDFQIPVIKTELGYFAEENQVTFTSFPEISHGVFDGIYSRNLEEQMKEIDWNANEQLYELDEQENVVLLPHIQSIRDSIEKLSVHEEAKDIAGYLRVKYWSDSFMEIYVPEEVWQMKNWQRVEHHFSLEDDAKVISNLMRGKFVHADCFSSLDYDSDSWLYIDKHVIQLVENSAIRFIEGPTRAQVETMVNMLPLDGNVFVSDMVYSLLKGEQVTVTLSGIDGKQKVIVNANPSEQRLELQTPHGQPIPFNFTLNPHWKPEVALPSEIKRNNSKRENPQVKSTKGKGNSPKM